MAKNALVTSAAGAKANIDAYERQIAGSLGLQRVMSYARAWHAYRKPDGSWHVAPSKFVGYENNSADSYLRSHRQRDGRRTERALSQWFEEVTQGTAAYNDAAAAVQRLFARYGRTPNARFRVGVLRTESKASLSGSVDVGRARIGLRSRITIDPRICNGRPTIRGMRIRVSDVLDMLAAGSGRKEILADFPYLEDADIGAALEYAAAAADHRIVSVG